ncbi:MAG: hypothetical protein HZB21_05435 [Deltaproteobacteria bacterium]|nr:hypothetical protein [Deltaproteobacteria bacterium]
MLASAAGHGVARHVSEVSGGTEAIGKAATDMGDKLIDQILAKWTSGQMIILRISGVRDYKKLADFKDTVKKRVRGVTNVYQRKLEEGVAVFELETKVPAQNIADDLVRLPGLGLKVTGATHGTVDAVMEAD